MRMNALPMVDRALPTKNPVFVIADSTHKRAAKKHAYHRCEDQRQETDCSVQGRLSHYKLVEKEEVIDRGEDDLKTIYRASELRKLPNYCI